jgi:hypothetical protein
VILRIVISIVIGGAGWLAIAWLLELAADAVAPTSALRNVLEIALAAFSPLTFGAFVWLILTAVVFVVLQLRARRRMV